MNTMQLKSRISLFVDGANMYYTQKDKLGWQIDWKRFLIYIKGDDILVDAFYYQGTKVPVDDQFREFLDFLAHSGYVLRTKDVREIVDYETGQVKRKANLDIEIVMDMFNTMDAYDHCVLATGDGDFARALDLLRGRGRRFTVLSTDGTCSMDLRRVAGTHFTDLNAIRSQIERRP